MLDLIFLNLRYIGYAAVLLGIVWLANFLLDLYYNIAIDVYKRQTESYGRAMIVYYPLCFVYLFTAFPLFAWFGGGKNGVRTMFRHVARPAICLLYTSTIVAVASEGVTPARLPPSKDASSNHMDPDLRLAS